MKSEIFRLITIFLLFPMALLSCVDQQKVEKIASEKSKKPLKEVSFNSGDNLKITANLYSDGNSKKPFIILFHQAKWSRGEYLETAPIFNNLGFNCMAVDQRSGEEVNEVVNQTAKRAVELSKGINYLDAYPDMVAALKYVKDNKLAEGKIVVLGSSYSSSLAFRLAAEYSEDVDGVLAFSPGEYFWKINGNRKYIEAFAAKVKCPVFITSAKNEKHYWESIYGTLKVLKVSYLPETDGNHGSRALWNKFADNGGYWVATKDFLKQFNL